MSIYVMTVGELAKKRGEPVGEFVKKIQATGFDAGSHAKKLTQDDLNRLIPLLDDTGNIILEKKEDNLQPRDVKNPNVLIIKTKDNRSVVAFVDASLNDDGTVSVEVVESSEEGSLGETLLEFRKQLGMKLGVN
jgi:S-adenosylmethionine hydrolase